MEQGATHGDGLRVELREWICVVRDDTRERLLREEGARGERLRFVAPGRLSGAWARRERGTGWILDAGVVGVAAVRRLLAAPSDDALVVITNDPAGVVDLVRSGLRVCIDAVEDGGVAMAMAAARVGMALWSPRLAARLRATIEAEADVGPSEARPTERERAMLALFARGLSYEETARLMAVSVNTVRTWVRAVYAKLEVVTKVEAVLVARRRGWIDTL